MTDKPRDVKIIDLELRLCAAVNETAREHGDPPSHRLVDELLEERLSATSSRPAGSLTPR